MARASSCNHTRISWDQCCGCLRRVRTHGQPRPTARQSVSSPIDADKLRSKRMQLIMLSCCRTYIQAVARATPKLRCTVCDNAVIHSPQEMFGQALLQPGQPHPGQYIWPTSQARFGAMAAASSQSSALFISPATPGQPSAAASPGHQLMVMPMTPPHPRTGPPPSPKAYLDYGLVTQEHHQKLVACVFDCGPPKTQMLFDNYRK